jgi:diguanylate cyclase (GGDEF)-like protein
MSGYQVCEALKATPSLVDIPVIFVTSHSEPAFEVAGFKIGAADFIAKPVSAALVLARVTMQLRVKSMADQLRRTATVDVVTGVATRRSFDESLEREWRRSRRTGTPLALLMIDIDHFKQFNDRYGHPAGDDCLRVVAQALVGTSMRPADLVARYGGEEFVMILPETPRAGAQQLAHRVLDRVEALEIAHEKSPTAGHVTVSVGVACYDKDSDCWTPPWLESNSGDPLRGRYGPSALLLAADKALYSAKRTGRAQAKLLDIADVDTPALVREIGRLSRDQPAVGTRRGTTTRAYTIGQLR